MNVFHQCPQTKQHALSGFSVFSRYEKERRTSELKELNILNEKMDGKLPPN